MKVIKTKFKFDDNTTRLYSFDCYDSLAAAVKPKIVAINNSLSAGTDDGLAEFFVSDNGENFVQISGATIESSTSVPVAIAPNS